MSTKAPISTSLTSVAVAATGQKIELATSTRSITIENRSTVAGEYVGVVFGNSDVTMDASLSEATTRIGPGFVRFVGRPGVSGRSTGSITHVFVRGSSGFSADIDVEQNVEQ